MRNFNKYLRVRNSLKTGDIVEFHGTGIISKLIRWRTHQKVNHTSVVIRLSSYYQNRIFIIEALSLVVLNPLSTRLENYDGHVYISKMKSENDRYREQIGRFLLMQCGKKYDYGGLFKQLFGHINIDLHRLFCSELATAALEHVGLWDKNDALWPGEFQKTRIFHPKIKIF